MPEYQNTVGVLVPEILLPQAAVDLKKWAVVACDQYTSQPDYWKRVEDYVADAPSTLHLTLPEVYLGTEEEPQRIEKIHSCMKNYLQNGLLQKQQPGFVWIRRQVANSVRTGLLMALDLECYDYHKGAQTLIRASEGTIESRIPPRLKIREHASVELPHILILIDDPDCTVIEPLVQQQERMKPLYDLELMENGGHIEGKLVDQPDMVERVLRSLESLKEKSVDPQSGAPLLFALGDGNHSFATAKAAWEKRKASLSEEEQKNHPARYALVEVVNVHDAGITFEPIHRVAFHVVDPDAFFVELKRCLEKGSASVTHCVCQSEQQLRQLCEASENAAAHVLPYFIADGCGAFVVHSPQQQLAVGTLQTALDELLQQPAFAGVELDYVHGDDTMKELAGKPSTVGFLLAAMKKSELFPTVRLDGALPRKTFSMGEANEKRYYLESRKID